MGAAGGMVSFLVGPGGPHDRTGPERATAVCEATRLFTLAESLGGVESLIEVPAAMTHASVAASPLRVEPNLVRLSVGIEAVEDLIADLARALDGA
jgi:cystathionine gamma-synthase